MWMSFSNIDPEWLDKIQCVIDEYWAEVMKRVMYGDQENPQPPQYIYGKPLFEDAEQAIAHYDELRQVPRDSEIDGGE